MRKHFPLVESKNDTLRHSSLLSSRFSVDWSTSRPFYAYLRARMWVLSTFTVPQPNNRHVARATSRDTPRIIHGQFIRANLLTAEMQKSISHRGAQREGENCTSDGHFLLHSSNRSRQLKIKIPFGRIRAEMRDVRYHYRSKYTLWPDNSGLQIIIPTIRRR